MPSTSLLETVAQKMEKNMRSSSVKVIFILLFVSAIFWELSCSDLQTEIRCWDTCPEYSYDIPETQIVIPVECGKAILFPSYDLRTYSELESVITEIGAVIDTIIFDRVQVSNFYCDEYDRAVLSDGIMHIHPCFRDAPQQHMSHSVVACFKGDVDSGVVDL